MALKAAIIWAICGLLPGTGAIRAQVGGGAPIPQQLPQIIILDGPPLPDLAPAPVPVLPIVNEGFADDEDVKGAIKPLVEALKSPEFGRREEATRALLRLPPGRLNEVVEALARETDAEAIERLTQAAAHLYLKPRTLLKTKASVLGVWHRQPGLSMLGLKFKMEAVKLMPEDGSATMTVMVTETQVGFPVMQTLRNGDRIVAVAGIGFPPDVPADDTSYFTARVGMLWPGAVVRMTILREGKLMEVGVQTAGVTVEGWITASEGANKKAEIVANRTAALGAFLRTLRMGDGVTG